MPIGKARTCIGAAAYDSSALLYMSTAVQIDGSSWAAVSVAAERVDKKTLGSFRTGCVAAIENHPLQ